MITVSGKHVEKFKAFYVR